ncbi:MAG: extracellular solute-binding protein [Clostridia bacterium]|nr:extracellular solute-binding protein [Clostridia bacterium]
MKKFLCIVLSGLLVFGGAVGCKAGKAPNTATDIEIVHWASGYGSNTMSILEQEFEKAYPEYNVVINSSAENNVDDLHLDPQNNTADLYFASLETRNAYTQYLEPLGNFIANTKPDGENGLTIQQKLGEFATIARPEDGEIYSLLGVTGSITGLFYNYNLFKDVDGNQLEEPRTTDELIDVVLEIQNAGQIPFVHYKHYWYYLHESWVAQYEGLNVFYDMWNGIYTDAQGNRYANDYRAITESKGREEAYAVLEPLLSKLGRTVTSTNNFDHTEAQTNFLNGNGVIMPNGSWVENEMNSSKKDIDVRLMKTPVLSALGTKLGIDEDQLRIFVDYVDGKTLEADEQAMVDVVGQQEVGGEKIVDIIATARSIHYISRPSDIFIPKYSIAKEGALKFLEFYYKDSTMKLVQETDQTFSDLTYSAEPNLNTSNWSKFKQQVNGVVKTATLVRTSMDKKIFYNGGLDKLWTNEHHPIEKLTYSNNSAQMQTAADFWAEEKAYWVENWNQICTNAGVTPSQLIAD